MHSVGAVSATAVVDCIDEALQNSEGTFRSPRMAEAEDTSAVEGEVHWKPVKSLWISGMTLAALIGGPLLLTWGALALFLATTAITVCLGHSLGMHRRLIHRAYDCPLWLERLFVYLGTLVGMAGPYGMIRQHDIRDWAQRKARCHPYLAHRSGFLRDGFWQLHCELKLAHPPQLVMERRVAEDRFYQFLERTWMAQQLPWVVLFFALGGLPWVIWGIAARVAASVTGHWLVGYFAHNRGPRSWHVEGAGVQGYNVRYCGLITMGEAWHNNHHAFPASARLGLHEGEADPGWWVLRALMAVGLVWNAKTPETLPHRANLVALKSQLEPAVRLPIGRQEWYGCAMQLPSDVQDWIDRQIKARAFKTPAEAIAFAVRQVAPMEDDLSWAKPLVDEAMAEIGRGEGISLSEAMRQVRDHIAARQAQWPAKSA